MCLTSHSNLINFPICEKNEYLYPKTNIGLNNSELDFMKKYSNSEAPKRSKIKNDVNGYAKMSCVIFGNKSYCVLRERYK